MQNLVNGLHHMTAIAGDPQKNVDFYAGILGLRFIKKTVNFDAPDVYHLYYGDGSGTPGSILTFFPYGNISRGRKGTGETSVTSFSVPSNALGFWMERLKKFQVVFKAPQKRFDEEFICFEDHDGLGLELVANDHDQRKGWITGGISAQYAIKGFFNVTLSEHGYERTAGLLTKHMEHRLVGEKGSLLRFEAGAGGPGTYIDIRCEPDMARAWQGSGSVHHIAFSTDNDESQAVIRQNLLRAGFNPTPVKDRQYFHSIYFKEPGGVLFEVATNNPGFAVDEPANALGSSLKLPEWHEPRRKQLEQVLQPLHLPEVV